MPYEPLLEEFFDADRCLRCGQCLAVCPEILTADPAALVASLIDGAPCEEVLERCSSCMTCSTACPRGCNPYGLVLYRWFRRGRESGYPVRASLVMPLEPGNAWHNVMKKVTPPERLLLDEWSDLSRPELKGRALFAGCNLQILPYMSESRVFDGLPIFGSPDLCCGEVYYRMGAFDRVNAQARALEKVYASLELDEIVTHCQACYNVLSNVLPARFGAHFGLKVSYFGDLVAARVLSGELPVEGKLKGRKVTLQDPCHAKLLSSEFMDTPRKVLEHMGCEVLEMRHNRECSLCCGLGHGAPRDNPLDMTRGVVRRLMEARATGAEDLVVFCNSCDLLFSVGTQLTPFIMPVRHLNELISEALGEDLPRRHLARARSMVFELFFKGAPKVLSRKRFSTREPC